MSSFDQKSLQALKELAKIHGSEQEDTALLDGISKILKHAENLQSIDTENVLATDSVLQGEKPFLREDIVEKTLDRKTFLDNAPNQVGGMIRTPLVIENQPS